MAPHTSKGRSARLSFPTFSVGNGTIVPVASHLFGTLEPFVASMTKIGKFKYVKRRFDLEDLRVIPEEDEVSTPSSKKRTLDGELKRIDSERNTVTGQNIGEVWVDPDAVDYNGKIIRPLQSPTAEPYYYNYYSTGPGSDLPNLQMKEAARNCEDSFTFRSRMYCEHERDQLTLPYEIRAMIYTHLFRGKPGKDSYPQSIALLKTLPLVCRFLYVDITTFINRDYFQLYFRHPLMLQAYLDKLNMVNSPVAKSQLNLTRLHCVILDLDKTSTDHPLRSRLVPPRHPVALGCLQKRMGLVPQPTVDPVNLAIRPPHRIDKADGREPADWADALATLLEEYEVARLVIRIGRGNTMKWKKLPKRLREVVEQGAGNATEWQVVKNVGGRKNQ